MMSYQSPPNDPLFSFNVQLESRVRKDHPLRKNCRSSGIEEEQPRASRWEWHRRAPAGYNGS